VAQLFVRQVHRVARLKCDHALPAALLDFVANLHRGPESIGKVGFEVTEIEHLDRTADGVASMPVEGRDAWMFAVVGAVDLFGHQRHLFIVDGFDSGDLLNRDHRVTLDIRVTQRDARGAFDLANRFHQVQHRYREKLAVAGMHVLGDAKRIGEVHVTLQWREVPATEHYRVGRGGGTDLHRRQPLGLFDKSIALGLVIDEQG